MDLNSKCGQEKLTLKSICYIEGEPRTNTAQLKQYADGSVMIFLDNGKYKSGKNRSACILLEREDVAELKVWLNAL